MSVNTRRRYIVPFLAPSQLRRRLCSLRGEYAREVIISRHCHGLWECLYNTFNNEMTIAVSLSSCIKIVSRLLYRIHNFMKQGKVSTLPRQKSAPTPLFTRKPVIFLGSLTFFLGHKIF